MKRILGVVFTGCLFIIVSSLVRKPTINIDPNTNGYAIDRRPATEEDEQNILSNQKVR